MAEIQDRAVQSKNVITVGPGNSKTLASPRLKYDSPFDRQSVPPHSGPRRIVLSDTIYTPFEAASVHHKESTRPSAAQLLLWFSLCWL